MSDGEYCVYNSSDLCLLISLLFVKILFIIVIVFFESFLSLFLLVFGVWITLRCIFNLFIYLIFIIFIKNNVKIINII